jgi:hypothetical protein
MGDCNSLETYVSLTVQLYHDIAQCYPEFKESRHDLRTMRERVSSEGISFLTKTLPKLGKAIDLALHSDIALQVPGFKKKSGTAIPLFLGWLLERIFLDSGYVRSDPDITALKHVRQLLYFTYKLSLPYDYETERSVIESFVKTEEELKKFEFPSSDDPVIKGARLFLSRAFSGLNAREIIPRHGPGAVSTREETGEKSNFSRIYSRIERIYPFTDYFVLGSSQISDQLDWIESLQPLEDGIAKVILVPKDSRGPRLISCEPLEFQWIQQGIQRKLYDWIESHELTAGHVNFRDQSVNRRLALEGSRTRKYVTLDMKDASDRVSLRLVEELFAGTTLLECLIASRSAYTQLPDGRVVQLAKFAPMGSAVCFPVEALCFFALAVAVLYIRYRSELPTPRIWGRDPDRFSEQAWAKAHDSVYVYGDDIIVRSEDFAPILEHFPRFGLLFNTSKCCTGGFFRESCGCDAYNGIEVTPIRLRTRWSHRGKRAADELVSWVELSNSLWEAGYWTTAELIRDMVEARYGHLPYTREKYEYIDHSTGRIKLDSPSLIGFYRSHVNESRLNRARLKYRRFCLNGKSARNVQRLEYRTWVIHPVIKTYKVDGWRECLRVLNTGSARSNVGDYALPRRVCLRRGWVAA